MSEQSTKMFQAVFENSPVGLVIVNKDTSVRDVNNYMFNMFKLKPRAMSSKRFGNLFDCCVAVSSNGTCGENKECSHCNLRSTIISALDEGISITDTIMNHEFFVEGQELKKWFKVSASRIVAEGDPFAIVSFSDISMQKEYEELLNYRLSLDMATGTTNKYALMNTLQSLAAAKKDMAVALVDFDNFKSINDTYGHVVGDKVINHFCSAAFANIRKHDVIGRFGGEEFMFIFLGASSGMLIKALERISKSFREACEKELRVSATFSAGLAEPYFDRMAEIDADSIVEEADSNLYLSKKRGKNMVTSRGLTISFEKSRKL
jgi:diguanylate cyclase (GGDEF)-like protein